MTGGRIGGLLALGLLALAPGAAQAHGLDPASLALRELGGGRFAIAWQVSALRVPGADVRPVLPAPCRQVGASEAADLGSRVALRWTVDCGAAGLDGREIRIADLAAAKINALLRIERQDGSETLTVLTPRQPAFTVARRAPWWEVLRSYAALGVEHILGGPDHLLFVVGLLLLVPTTRLLLETITAFTLGHSLTLSAAALHVAHVPSRPVEVLIAASVLVLAVELASGGDEARWLRRRPWTMAAAFGLLHGLGFAGALAEAGLPAGDVPVALAAFNVGIELGQIAFVGAALAAGAALRRCAPRAAARGLRPAVYAMGIVAAFWTLERMALWLG